MILKLKIKNQLSKGKTKVALKRKKCRPKNIIILPVINLLEIILGPL